jgi:hypothetical protein
VFGCRNDLSHHRKDIDMTLPTQQLSKQILLKALRVVTFAMLLVVFGVSTALAQTRAAKTAAAPDEQVSFTATGTAVITGVTKLPGGLTQVNVSTSGKQRISVTSPDR